MSFKDILGQDRAIEFLKNSIANNRVASAYLFVGPSGIGKKLTALNFAKALNCAAETNQRPCDPSAGSGSHPELVDGCDVCIPCKKIDASNHPDVFMLGPEKEGASVKIGAIRDLIRSIGLKPYEARNKVFIIDEARAMGRAAANALLKTLEEPPPASVLILITDNPRGLFPTIVSRCQLVRFFALDGAYVKEILAKNYQTDEKTAGVLERLSSGSVGRALRYKNEDFANRRERTINGLVDRTFFDSDFDGVSKDEMRSYLDIMLTWYRDVLVAKVQGDSARLSSLINADRRDEIFAQAKQAGFEELNRAIKEIIRTGSYLEQNVNAKLAMTVLGVNICTK